MYGARQYLLIRYFHVDNKQFPEPVSVYHQRGPTARIILYKYHNNEHHEYPGVCLGFVCCEQMVHFQQMCLI